VREKKAPSHSLQNLLNFGLSKKVSYTPPLVSVLGAKECECVELGLSNIKSSLKPDCTMQMILSLVYLETLGLICFILWYFVTDWWICLFPSFCEWIRQTPPFLACLVHPSCVQVLTFAPCLTHTPLFLL